MKPAHSPREFRIGKLAAQPVQVMIVDDSLTVRTILKRMVESDPALIVAATASSAETALAQLKTIKPDVILLDLEMPGMGGLKALPAILAVAPYVEVLVVSALTEEGAEATLAALAMGAADTLLKPRPGEFTEDYRSTLIARIRALGTKASASSGAKEPAAAAGTARAPLGGAGTEFPKIKRPDIIAIGASTGGIHALGQFLAEVTSALTQPILITQHLPASFMPVFARQIAAAWGRHTVVASDGLVIAPGTIVVASGAGHLTIQRKGDELAVQISYAPTASGCRPSVDPMLASLAQTCGPRALAVILSGMGTDGLAGSRLLHDAGGTIFAQDPASSAVWGMPGAVARAGLARLLASPETLGQAVMACAAARALS